MYDLDAQRMRVLRGGAAAAAAAAFSVSLRSQNMDAIPVTWMVVGVFVNNEFMEQRVNWWESDAIDWFDQWVITTIPMYIDYRIYAAIILQLLNYRFCHALDRSFRSPLFGGLTTVSHHTYLTISYPFKYISIDSTFKLKYVSMYPIINIRRHIETRGRKGEEKPIVLRVCFWNWTGGEDIDLLY